MTQTLTRPSACDSRPPACPSHLPAAAPAGGGLWEVYTAIGMVRFNDPAAWLVAIGGCRNGSVSAEAIMAVFDRAIARSKLLEALDPQDCYLCGAWLPCSDDLPGSHRIECTGCGAAYTNFGRWQHVSSMRDAQNPYHSALYMRRYGYDADYMRHVGWAVPPDWLLVRFRGEPVDER